MNIASAGGPDRVANGFGAYGVSKAALVYATWQLALELAPNVRVNCVAPGLVPTRFLEPMYSGREGEAAAYHPLARLGRPGDIAATAAHLLSDDASWITGQVHVVDGVGRLPLGKATPPPPREESETKSLAVSDSDDSEEGGAENGRS